jgi:hypothetical protein
MDVIPGEDQVKLPLRLNAAAHQDLLLCRHKTVVCSQMHAGDAA